MAIAIKKINFTQKIISYLKEQNWIKIMIYVSIAFILGRGAFFDFLFPFVLSFFAAVITIKKYYSILGIPLLLGMVSYHAPLHIILKYILIMSLLFGANFFFDRLKVKSAVVTASLVSMVCLMTLVGYHFASEVILIFDIFLMITETAAVFVFTYIFLRMPNLLEWEKQNNHISSEDVLCVIVILAVALSSIKDLQIYSIRIKYVFTLLMVLITSFRGGFTIGAAMGVMAGVIIAMTGYEPQSIIGFFGFSGLIAGFFKNTYRILNCLAWTLSMVVMSFYFDGLSVNYILFQEVAVASILFLIIPNKWTAKITDKIKSLMPYALTIDYPDKVRKMMIKDLTGYSNTFESLATLYGRAFERTESIGKEDVNQILSKIKSRICSQCDFNKTCWKENNCKTEEVMKEIIYRADKGIKIETDYIRSDMGFTCEYLSQVIFFTQSIVQVFSTNYKWQKKLEGSREITASQFRCVSKSIDDMIREINKNQLFNKNIENKIYRQLRLDRIPIKHISVLQREYGYEIIIESNKVLDNIGFLEHTISELIQEPYIVTGENTCPHTIILKRRPKYQVVTGASKYAKENNICGDSFAYMKLKENEYMIALSDGMGTGEKAARESMMTIDTLQYLLKAGFEKELALKTMNSMLLLKSTEEIFSTVDITTIDLNTGNTSFYKIGAAAAFIKRPNNEVEVIKYSALPIGIIDQIKIEEINVGITPSDTIIMVSDGILDGYEGNEKLEWIARVIKNIQSKDPQTITDLILNKAIEQYGTSEKDDMTVIAAKII